MNDPMSATGGTDPGAIATYVGGAHLELNGIHKRFGGIRALRGADLKISSVGVVHGLMGENGSGKSTLLGVLSGQLQPDGGQISINGVPVSFANPTTALRGGIAMVSQESALASELTIAENIFLGRRMVRGWGGINWKATCRRAEEVLARLELSYDPRWPVHRLRPDQKQMVEIARALSMNTQVLILDEPTSSLTDDEVQALFRAIRQIKGAGVATIFVSHRFSEVFDLVDELTVLRDGSTAAEGPVQDFDPHSLVDAMVGKEGAWKDYARPVRTSRAQEADSPALEVTGMTIPGRVYHADLDVARGEIVGVAGLVGAGRSELLEGIFGLRPVTEGSITVAGKPISARSPRAAIGQGLGFLPPDRKSQGLVLQRTIDENLTMVATLSRSRFRPPGGRDIDAKVQEITRTMRLRATSHRSLVSTLSGGNQQKVAVGKWLMADPRVLLLDEPTRGVDVAAKSEIHELLRGVAKSGVGLLVVSSENDELIELCDRILVMFRGRIVASMTAGEADEPTIARYAGGHV
ncbi:MAG: sugar ABC transporter ATP-binding protein [Actinomycetota bacterium]|nr:sugar ABC transporter ATP-binding protein [Actinomycetota bacterium]